MRCVLRIFAIAGVVLSIVACGGGGGGSTDGTSAPTSPSPPPTVPPTPPALRAPAALEPQTYQEAVWSMGQLTDLALLVNQIAASAVEWASTATSTSTTEPCATSGSVRLEWQDTDRSGSFSASDRVVYRLLACSEGSATVEADFNIEISSITRAQQELLVQMRIAIGTFSITHDGRTASILGTLVSSWTHSPLQDSFFHLGRSVLDDARWCVGKPCGFRRYL